MEKSTDGSAAIDRDRLVDALCGELAELVRSNADCRRKLIESSVWADLKRADALLPLPPSTTASVLGRVNIRLAGLGVLLAGLALLVYHLFERQPACLVPTPDVLQDVLKPAADCRVCANFSSIDRVSRVDWRQFEASYVQTGRVVVVTDEASAWPALQQFSFDFFKDLYQNMTSDNEAEFVAQFFGYKTEFHTLRDFLSMSAARRREPWYVGWSNTHPNISARLRQLYWTPRFLPGDSQPTAVDWIFMGTPGYGAPMHVDSVGLSSWQAQVRGTKRWRFLAPPECWGVCGAGVVSVRVGPGDIIVVDTNLWYHATEVLGYEISIAIVAEFD